MKKFTVRVQFTGILLGIAMAVLHLSAEATEWDITTPSGTEEAKHSHSQYSQIAVYGHHPSGDQTGVLKVFNGMTSLQEQAVEITEFGTEYNETLPVPGNGTWGVGTRMLRVYALEGGIQIQKDQEWLDMI